MLTPLPASAWTPAHANHLLARAGFGGTPEEIAALYALGPAAAVDSLIAGDEDADLFPPPDWTNDPRSLYTVFNEENGKPTTDIGRMERAREVRKIERVRGEDLLVGWLRRMEFTTHPLREKLTLFWHDHFATSNQKVQDAYLMWVQNETLRARALGPFGYLLKDIARDSAMIKWLDLGRSNKKQPNENFAREFFELFALGEGNYSESDIKETARAFTGYRYNGAARTFAFIRKQHDTGDKTILGQTGNFDGDDVVQLALESPHCAPFLAGKLWTYFVSEQPNPEAVDALATVLRDNDYEIAPALRALFRSAAFYDPAVRRTQIKSPVQWLVQTCRTLGTPVPEPPLLTGALVQLGQLPFVPPNVGGWEWGRSWINSTTLILRYNLAGFLLGSTEKSIARLFQRDDRFDPPIEELAPDPMRARPEALADAMVLRLFGPGDFPDLRDLVLAGLTQLGPTLTDDDVRSVLHQLMSTPEYQLT